MLHAKGMEIVKDRGKVTSLVIAKEHVTFSHAWLESQKYNCKRKLCTNAPIPALRFGASYFHLLPSEAPLPSEGIGAFFQNLFLKGFFDSSQAWLQGHMLFRSNL